MNMETGGTTLKPRPRRKSEILGEQRSRKARHEPVFYDDAAERLRLKKAIESCRKKINTIHDESSYFVLIEEYKALLQVLEKLNNRNNRIAGGLKAIEKQEKKRTEKLRKIFDKTVGPKLSSTLFGSEALSAVSQELCAVGLKLLEKGKAYQADAAVIEALSISNGSNGEAGKEIIQKALQFTQEMSSLFAWFNSFNFSLVSSQLSRYNFLMRAPEKSAEASKWLREELTDNAYLLQAEQLPHRKEELELLNERLQAFISSVPKESADPIVIGMRQEMVRYQEWVSRTLNNLYEQNAVIRKIGAQQKELVAWVPEKVAEEERTLSEKVYVKPKRWLTRDEVYKLYQPRMVIELEILQQKLLREMHEIVSSSVTDYHRVARAVEKEARKQEVAKKLTDIEEKLPAVDSFEELDQQKKAMGQLMWTRLALSAPSEKFTSDVDGFLQEVDAFESRKEGIVTQSDDGAFKAVIADIDAPKEAQTVGDLRTYQDAPIIKKKGSDQYHSCYESIDLKRQLTRCEERIEGKKEEILKRKATAQKNIQKANEFLTLSLDDLKFKDQTIKKIDAAIEKMPEAISTEKLTQEKLALFKIVGEVNSDRSRLSHCLEATEFHLDIVSQLSEDELSSEGRAKLTKALQARKELLESLAEEFDAQLVELESKKETALKTYNELMVAHLSAVEQLVEVKRLYDATLEIEIEVKLVAEYEQRLNVAEEIVDLEACRDAIAKEVRLLSVMEKRIGTSVFDLKQQADNIQLSAFREISAQDKQFVEEQIPARLVELKAKKEKLAEAVVELMHLKEGADQKIVAIAEKERREQEVAPIVEEKPEEVIAEELKEELGESEEALDEELLQVEEEYKERIDDKREEIKSKEGHFAPEPGFPTEVPVLEEAKAEEVEVKVEKRRPEQAEIISKPQVEEVPPVEEVVEIQKPAEFADEELAIISNKIDAVLKPLEGFDLDLTLKQLHAYLLMLDQKLTATQFAWLDRELFESNPWMHDVDSLVKNEGALQWFAFVLDDLKQDLRIQADEHLLADLEKIAYINQHYETLKKQRQILINWKETNEVGHVALNQYVKGEFLDSSSLAQVQLEIINRDSEIIRRKSLLEENKAYVSEHQEEIENIAKSLEKLKEKFNLATTSEQSEQVKAEAEQFYKKHSELLDQLFLFWSAIRNNVSAAKTIGALQPGMPKDVVVFLEEPSNVARKLKGFSKEEFEDEKFYENHSRDLNQLFLFWSVIRGDLNIAAELKSTFPDISEEVAKRIEVKFQATNPQVDQFYQDNINSFQHLFQFWESAHKQLKELGIDFLPQKIRTDAANVNQFAVPGSIQELLDIFYILSGGEERYYRADQSYTEQYLLVKTIFQLNDGIKTMLSKKPEEIKKLNAESQRVQKTAKQHLVDTLVPMDVDDVLKEFIEAAEAIKESEDIHKLNELHKKFQNTLEQVSKTSDQYREQCLRLEKDQTALHKIDSAYIETETRGDLLVQVGATLGQVQKVQSEIGKFEQWIKKEYASVKVLYDKKISSRIDAVAPTYKTFKAQWEEIKLSYRADGISDLQDQFARYFLFISQATTKEQREFLRRELLNNNLSWFVDVGCHLKLRAQIEELQSKLDALPKAQQEIQQVQELIDTVQSFSKIIESKEWEVVEHQCDILQAWAGNPRDVSSETVQGNIPDLDAMGSKITENPNNMSANILFYDLQHVVIGEYHVVQAALGSVLSREGSHSLLDDFEFATNGEEFLSKLPQSIRSIIDSINKAENEADIKAVESEIAKLPLEQRTFFLVADQFVLYSSDSISLLDQQYQVERNSESLLHDKAYFECERSYEDEVRPAIEKFKQFKQAFDGFSISKKREEIADKYVKAEIQTSKKLQVSLIETPKVSVKKIGLQKAKRLIAAISDEKTSLRSAVKNYHELFEMMSFSSKESIELLELIQKAEEEKRKLQSTNPSYVALESLQSKWVSQYLELTHWLSEIADQSATMRDAFESKFKGASKKDVQAVLNIIQGFLTETITPLSEIFEIQKNKIASNDELFLALERLEVQLRKAESSEDAAAVDTVATVRETIATLDPRLIKFVGLSDIFIGGSDLIGEMIDVVSVKAEEKKSQRVLCESLARKYQSSCKQSVSVSKKLDRTDISKEQQVIWLVKQVGSSVVDSRLTESVPKVLEEKFEKIEVAEKDAQALIVKTEDFYKGYSSDVYQERAKKLTENKAVIAGKLQKEFSDIESLSDLLSEAGKHIQEGEKLEKELDVTAIQKVGRLISDYEMMLSNSFLSEKTQSELREKIEQLKALQKELTKLKESIHAACQTIESQITENAFQVRVKAIIDEQMNQLQRDKKGFSSDVDRLEQKLSEAKTHVETFLDNVKERRPKDSVGLLEQYLKGEKCLRELSDFAVVQYTPVQRELSKRYQKFYPVLQTIVTTAGFDDEAVSKVELELVDLILRLTPDENKKRRRKELERVSSLKEIGLTEAQKTDIETERTELSWKAKDIVDAHQKELKKVLQDDPKILSVISQGKECARYVSETLDFEFKKSSVWCDAQKAAQELLPDVEAKIAELENLLVVEGVQEYPIGADIQKQLDALKKQQEQLTLISEGKLEELVLEDDALSHQMKIFCDSFETGQPKLAVLNDMLMDESSRQVLLSGPDLLKQYRNYNSKLIQFLASEASDEFIDQQMKETKVNDVELERWVWVAENCLREKNEKRFNKIIELLAPYAESLLKENAISSQAQKTLKELQGKYEEKKGKIEIEETKTIEMTSTPESKILMIPTPVMDHSSVLLQLATMSALADSPDSTYINGMLDDPDSVEFLERNSQAYSQFQAIEQKIVQETAKALHAQAVKLFLEIPFEDIKKPLNKEKVKRMAEFEERLSAHVICDIIERQSLQARVVALQRWIDVASLCLKKGNFSSYMAIIGAFGSSPMQRAQSTIKNLSEEYQKKLKEYFLVADASRNYSALQKRMQLYGERPTIPYMEINIAMSDKFHDDGQTIISPKVFEYYIQVRARQLQNVELCNYELMQKAALKVKVQLCQQDRIRRFHELRAKSCLSDAEKIAFSKKGIKVELSKEEQDELDRLWIDAKLSSLERAAYEVEKIDLPPSSKLSEVAESYVVSIENASYDNAILSDRVKAEEKKYEREKLTLSVVPAIVEHQMQDISKLPVEKEFTEKEFVLSEIKNDKLVEIMLEKGLSFSKNATQVQMEKLNKYFQKPTSYKELQKLLKQMGVVLDDVNVQKVKQDALLKLFDNKILAAFFGNKIAQSKENRALKAKGGATTQSVIKEINVLFSSKAEVSSEELKTLLSKFNIELNDDELGYLITLQKAYCDLFVTPGKVIDAESITNEMNLIQGRLNELTEVAAINISDIVDIYSSLTLMMSKVIGYKLSLRQLHIDIQKNIQSIKAIPSGFIEQAVLSELIESLQEREKSWANQLEEAESLLGLNVKMTSDVDILLRSYLENETAKKAQLESKVKEFEKSTQEMDKFFKASTLDGLVRLAHLIYYQQLLNNEFSFPVDDSLNQTVPQEITEISKEAKSYNKLLKDQIGILTVNRELSQKRKEQVANEIATACQKELPKLQNDCDLLKSQVNVVMSKILAFGKYYAVTKDEEYVQKDFWESIVNLDEIRSFLVDINSHLDLLSLMIQVGDVDSATHKLYKEFTEIKDSLSWMVMSDETSNVDKLQLASYETIKGNKFAYAHSNVKLEGDNDFDVALKQLGEYIVNKEEKMIQVKKDMERLKGDEAKETFNKYPLELAYYEEIIKKLNAPTKTIGVPSAKEVNFDKDNKTDQALSRLGLYVNKNEDELKATRETINLLESEAGKKYFEENPSKKYYYRLLKEKIEHPIKPRPMQKVLEKENVQIKKKRWFGKKGTNGSSRAVFTILGLTYPPLRDTAKKRSFWAKFVDWVIGEQVVEKKKPKRRKVIISIEEQKKEQALIEEMKERKKRVLEKFVESSSEEEKVEEKKSYRPEL